MWHSLRLVSSRIDENQNFSCQCLQKTIIRNFYYQELLTVNFFYRYYMFFLCFSFLDSQQWSYLYASLSTFLITYTMCISEPQALERNLRFRFGCISRRMFYKTHKSKIVLLLLLFVCNIINSEATGCKGPYNPSLYAKLDRFCEDCYYLFRQPSLMGLCRWVQKFRDKIWKHGR